VLAGRYRLEDRVQATPDGSIWRAVDETLERQVTIRVLRAGHPFAADVADAARRAVLIDDPRLVRVLDVGVHCDTVFIVTEYFAGDTLTQLIRRGPLPAEEVRRLVGEASQALDRASQRGLHHLRLRPDEVVVRPDGSIKLLGLAVEAAAAGLDSDPMATSDRVDTVALAALAYAGLTGRWPMEESSGLDLAPRQDGGPIGVEVLAPDAPTDLVELCALILGPYDVGPRSPGALAAELAPWGEARPAQQPRALPLRPAAGSSDTLVVDGPARAAEAPRPGAAAAAEPPQPPDHWQPCADRPPAADRHSAAEPRHPASPIRAHGVGVEDTGSGLPTLLPFDDDTVPGNGSRAAARYVGGGNGTGPPPATDGNGAAVRSHRGPGTAAARHGPIGPTGGPTAPPVPVSADARTEHRTEPRVDRRAEPRTDPRTDPRAESAGQRRIPGPSGPHPITLGDGVPRAQPLRAEPDTLLPWPDSWPGRQPADEPSLGPFPLAPVADKPTSGQSRAVIVALLVVLLLVGVFAVYSLRTIKPDTTLLNPGPGFTPPVTGSVKPSGNASSPPATPSRPPTVAARKPSVLNVVSIDPGGDGSEHPELVGRAFDGDPQTFWRTDGYQTVDFSGAKKGVGLVLDLGRPTTVSVVTVDSLGRGGALELRVTNDPGSPGTKVIARSAISQGQATLSPPRGTVVSRYLVLWCTELPRLSGTKYRLDVSEITVR
jgi:eukaryotic-like serine/threonine-protein kinase